MKKPDINNKVETLTNTYKFTNNDSSSYEVEANQVLTIIDIFTETIDIKRDLIVGKNATLNYIKIGKSQNSSTIKYTNSIEENGILNITFLDYESSKNTMETKLTHDDSSLNINGLLDLQNSTKVKYDIKTNHQAKSFSDIKFKNLLYDKATAKLNMFSIVEENASFSKAFQNSQTILLSDDSSIAVTPHLEISIDELEASHGATSGDLDKDSIYYLESRGIKEEDAKNMLLDAIRNEVYETIENKELVEYLKGLV